MAPPATGVPTEVYVSPSDGLNHSPLLAESERQQRHFVTFHHVLTAERTGADWGFLTS